MLHEYFLYELTIGVIMKGIGKVKEKQKVHVLTRIQILVSTFTAKSTGLWIYTAITVDGPLDRLDGQHRHF